MNCDSKRVRYFTWDAALFPEPAALQEDIASRGRRTVTIIDPHIKRDPSYHIYSEAARLDYFVKDRDGKEFDGRASRSAFLAGVLVLHGITGCICFRPFLAGQRLAICKAPPWALVHVYTTALTAAARCMGQITQLRLRT